MLRAVQRVRAAVPILLLGVLMLGLEDFHSGVQTHGHT